MKIIQPIYIPHQIEYEYRFISSAILGNYDRQYLGCNYESTYRNYIYFKGVEIYDSANKQS